MCRTCLVYNGKIIKSKRLILKIQMYQINDKSTDEVNDKINKENNDKINN